MAEMDGLEKQLLQGYWPLEEAKQKGRPVKTWLDEIKKMGKAWTERRKKIKTEKDCKSSQF
jgi:hypothetical protein